MLEEKVSDIEESSDKEDRGVVLLKDVAARLKSTILIITSFATSRWENGEGEGEGTLTKISLEVAI